MFARCRQGVLALVLVACAARPSAQVHEAEHEDPCAGASAVDVRHHDVQLTASLDPARLEGEGSIHLVARVPTRAVLLDARRLQVRAVRDDEGALAFRQQHDRLCARLARPLAAGEARTLQLAWRASPDAKKMPRAHPDVLWAGYQTSAWMPTRQDPAQRATLRLRLRAPRALAVVASGRALGSTALAGGLREHAFALDQPSPPFLFAFAVGRFDRDERDVDGVDGVDGAHGVTLRALGPRGATLAEAQSIAAELVRMLGALLGQPFPGATYTQVFVPGDAAQEAVGLALMSASALDDLHADPHDDWLLSHELAHQWFAFLVPCADFSDFWLNEGFATFMVGVVKERREGRAAYEAERRRWRERSDRVHAEGEDAPVAALSPGLPEDALPPVGVTYMRGALVLDRLRSTLGDDAFWRGVRAYLRAQAGKPTRTEDLRRALEQASGRDLEAFFATWVYAPAWAFSEEVRAR